MAGQHENDKQVKGFASSVEEAQAKILEKKLKKTVTFGDLFRELHIFATNINAHVQLIYEHGVDKHGNPLKIARDAEVAKSRKAAEMQTEGHSPVPPTKEEALALQAVLDAADDVAEKADALGASE